MLTIEFDWSETQHSAKDHLKDVADGELTPCEK